MTTCVPCERVATAVRRYGHTDRKLLPEYLRNPQTESEFVLAFAVAAWSRGVTPICEDGCVTGFEGIGLAGIIKSATAHLN